MQEKHLGSGLHFLTEPIRIESNTHLSAEAGCRLCGGVLLKATPAGGGLWVCDLKEAGISPAPFASRGMGRKITPSHSELFIDGRPLLLSRYPRNDFVKISGVGKPILDEWDSPCGALDGGFFYEDDRPLQWADGQDIWVHGYWSWDWAPTREGIGAWDKPRGFLETLPPFGQYQFRVGQRFCFFNILEEVTEPGDYCIDFRSGKLWFIPREDFSPESSEIMLSLCDKPAFALENVENVTLEGFSIEAFRGNAVTIRNCKNVTLRGCTIRNIGNRAVIADDSFGVTVSDCTVHDTGDGGIHFYCGDRPTLTPGDCAVENCHIYRISNWDRCYEPPIRLYGVGLRAVGNTIHDCPHSAILFGGNDISVTDNEIYRVVTETGDAGAIYGGRDYTFRGNEVSRNFVHHVGGTVGIGAMGIYNDDSISGTVMRDNVFYKVQRAVFLGGGVDYVVENNVFIDCQPAICGDDRGCHEHPVWRKMVDKPLRERFYSIAGSGVSATDEPYLQRWPELAKLDAYYKAEPIPHVRASATIADNLSCESRWLDYSWEVHGCDFREENNRVIDRADLRRYLTEHEYSVVTQE